MFGYIDVNCVRNVLPNCQIPPETPFSPSYRAQLIAIGKENRHVHLYLTTLLHQSQGIQTGAENYKVFHLDPGIQTPAFSPF
jgi:hypothetical protein